MKHLGIMNFDLSPSQRDLLSQAEKACQAIRPLEDHAYLSRAINDKVVAVLSKFNLLGVPIDERFGGLGADTLSFTLVMQRMGKESASLRTFLSAHICLGQQTIQQWGSEEHKRKILPQSTKGQKILCFALDEESTCSDPESMQSMYEARGKGKGFILTGTKMWVANAGIADMIIAVAKNKKTGHYSAFVIDRKAKGIIVEEEPHRIGMHSVSIGRIHFKQVQIPQEALIGQEGSGLHIAYSALLNERLSIAAGCVGAMEDCLFEATMHAKTRMAFGKEIGKHQLVQRHLAVMGTNTEAVKWMLYRTAVESQHYAEHPSDKFLPYIEGLVAKAKWHATTSAQDSARRSMQILGEYGYTLKSRSCRHFADLCGAGIHQGSNEILQQKIALSILGEEFKAFR